MPFSRIKNSKKTLIVAIVIVAIVNMTRHSEPACSVYIYNPKYFLLIQWLEIKTRGCRRHVFLVISIISSYAADVAIACERFPERRLRNTHAMLVKIKL